MILGVNSCKTALLFNKFGSKEVLQLKEIKTPTPKDNEVLIKTHAAAINPIDYKIRNGSSFVAKNLSLPSGLGFELSGVIAAVGCNIDNFSVGDQVFGIAGFPSRPGCQAEYVCRTPEALVIKPKEISYAMAACLPIAGLTALQSLEMTNIQQGQSILIHSGSGGVGHIAIQLAKQMGAYVYTTASMKNHDFLYGIGADLCIDYHTEDFTEVINKPVDVILDLMGGEVGVRSLNILSKDGILITIPTITAEQVVSAAKSRGLSAKGMLMELNTNQLRYLANMVVDNKLDVKVGHSYKISEAQKAHEDLEASSVCGKRVFIF